MTIGGRAFGARPVCTQVRSNLTFGESPARFSPASVTASSENRNQIASHSSGIIILPFPRSRVFQVAHDCGMLPLALGMVGTLAKDQPLDPASWRTVHEKLQAKHTKFLKIDNAKLFYAIDISLHDLPSTQQEQLQLMAVLASGVVATSEMLANLWNKVRNAFRMLLVADYAVFHMCFVRTRWPSRSLGYACHLLTLFLCSVLLLLTLLRHPH